jgi:hypothetical protein
MARFEILMRRTSSWQSKHVARQSRDEKSNVCGAHDGNFGVMMFREIAGQLFGLRDGAGDKVHN